MDPVFEQRLIDFQNKTPQQSPSKVCQGNRFIPRRSKAVWKINFDNIEDNRGKEYSLTQSQQHEETMGENGQLSTSPFSHLNIPNINHTNNDNDLNNRGTSNRNSRREDSNPNLTLYSRLIKTELLDQDYENRELLRSRNEVLKPLSSNKNLFQYHLVSSPSSSSSLSSSFSLSPVSKKSQQLLLSPKKNMRRIQQTAFKILDAPDLVDDYYLNLVHWSNLNILAVGLSHSLYLWNAHNSQVTKLCDLSSDQDSVTSVSWNEKGTLLGVGSEKGEVQIWDPLQQKRILLFQNHSSRVGALAWNNQIVTSGSKDKTIANQDIRLSNNNVRNSTPMNHENKCTFRWVEHKQEVCGMRWSPDKQILASGGNDNKLLLWSLKQTSKPLALFNQHSAAVKAICWSPHHHGLLCSGGGTADRHIRFFNTLTLRPMHSVNTGSQVCNLEWSKHSDEIVSSHGYSENEIILWNGNNMRIVSRLTGHTMRVLYLAASPDGETIVTGAGDETLRFWKVFNKSSNKKIQNSPLNMFQNLR